MNLVPDNFLTLDFLLSLLIEYFESACRFSEKRWKWNLNIWIMDNPQQKKFLKK